MFRNVALKNISISLQNIYRFLSKLIVLNAIQKGFGICVIVNLSQSFIVLCWQYQIEICHIISARRAGPKQNLALRRQKDKKQELLHKHLFSPETQCKSVVLSGQTSSTKVDNQENCPN